MNRRTDWDLRASPMLMVSLTMTLARLPGSMDLNELVSGTVEPSKGFLVRSYAVRLLRVATGSRCRCGVARRRISGTPSIRSGLRSHLAGRASLTAIVITRVETRLMNKSSQCKRRFGVIYSTTSQQRRAHNLTRVNAEGTDQPLAGVSE